MHAPSAITVRKFDETEFLMDRRLRLSALEESRDAFASTLAVEHSRSDDQWSLRLHTACNLGFDPPLIGYLGAKAAGIAWGKVDSSDRTIVNVYQMWVAPECRGHGLARIFLRTIVEWAASRRARSIQLAVVCAESPPKQRYVSEGFVPTEQLVPLRPGSMLMVQSMLLKTDRAKV
jgi:GNAT superfamily N-acetyltransferase